MSLHRPPLGDGHGAEVGTLEHELLAVCDEIPLVLRRVQALDGHVQQGVCNAVTGAGLGHRLAFLVLGALEASHADFMAFSTL